MKLLHSTNCILWYLNRSLLYTLKVILDKFSNCCFRI